MQKIDSDAVVREIHRIGLQRTPCEACGIVTEFGDVIELPNLSSDPEKSYIIATAELPRYIREGEAFIIWHTHPSGRVGPSKGDLHNRVEGLEYMVISLPDGTAVRY